jgi:hypothetical protein
LKEYREELDSELQIRITKYKNEPISSAVCDQIQAELEKKKMFDTFLGETGEKTEPVKSLKNEISNILYNSKIKYCALLGFTSSNGNCYDQINHAIPFKPKNLNPHSHSIIANTNYNINLFKSAIGVTYDSFTGEFKTQVLDFQNSASTITDPNTNQIYNLPDEVKVILNFMNIKIL